MTLDCVIFVEKTSWYPESSFDRTVFCLLQPIFWNNVKMLQWFSSLKAALLGSRCSKFCCWPKFLHGLRWRLRYHRLRFFFLFVYCSWTGRSQIASRRLWKEFKDQFFSARGHKVEPWQIMIDTFKARVFATTGVIHHGIFFERRINSMGAEVQWERRSMGAGRGSSVQRSEAEEWTTPASAVYFFSSWESRIAGGCRGVPACTRATEKCGRPLVGGYRLGVGHKCCKYSWNFWIFMLLFCANHRDVSRRFEWECRTWQIALFLVVTRGPSPASCTLGFVYFDVLWRQVASHLLKRINGYLEEQQFTRFSFVNLILYSNPQPIIEK